MVFAPLAQVARLLCCQRSLASQILGTCEVRLRLRSGGVPTEREHPGATFQRYIHLSSQKKGKLFFHVLSISFSMPVIQVVTTLRFRVKYSPRENAPLEIDIKRPVHMIFTYQHATVWHVNCS